MCGVGVYIVRMTVDVWCGCVYCADDSVGVYIVRMTGCVVWVCILCG